MPGKGGKQRYQPCILLHPVCLFCCLSFSTPGERPQYYFAPGTSLSDEVSHALFPHCLPLEWRVVVRHFADYVYAFCCWTVTPFDLSKVCGWICRSSLCGRSLNSDGVVRFVIDLAGLWTALS